MRNFALIILTIIITICGCAKSEQMAMLEGIEDLLKNDLNDSAYAMIEKIDETSITENEGKALYYLLKTQTYFRKRIPVSDSMITFSVNYYNKEKDFKKQAYAYYYKAVIQENNDTAIICYKNAEYYAQKFDDPRLLSNIYWGLGAININVGDQNLSLKYFKKQFEISKKLPLSKHINSMINMTQIYKNTEQIDSALKYAKMAIKHKDLIPPIMWSQLANDLGDIYMDIDKTKALKLYEESAKYDYRPSCFLKLSKLYLERGETDKADNLMRRTMDSCWYEIKIDILKTRSGIECENGNWQKAFQLMREISELKESLSERIANTRVVERQMEFESKLAESEYRNKALKIQSYVIFGILLIVILMILLRYRQLSAKKKIADKQLEINKLRKDIEVLSASGIKSSQMLDKLKEELLKITEHAEEKDTHAEELYKSIIFNTPIVRWTDVDLHEFTTYFLDNNSPLRVVMEQEYAKLTDNDRMLMILEYLGKDEDCILRILGIAKDSLRVRRHRINQKKIIDKIS